MLLITAIIKFNWFAFKQTLRERKSKRIKAKIKKNPNYNPIALFNVDKFRRTGIFAPDDERICEYLGIPKKYLVYE